MFPGNQSTDIIENKFNVVFVITQTLKMYFMLINWSNMSIKNIRSFAIVSMVIFRRIKKEDFLRQLNFFLLCTQ